MNLSPRLSRLLAILLLVLVIGAIYRLAVLPAWDRYANQRDDISNKENQLVRLGQIAAQAQGARRQLQSLESNPDLERLLLRAESPTLAAASLQEQLKEVVERHGGRLTSTQVIPPGSDASFQRVGLKVRMSVNSETAQRVFHELVDDRLNVATIHVSAIQAGDMHRLVLAALSMKHPMERTAQLCGLGHRKKTTVTRRQKSNQPLVDVILDP